MTPHVSTEAANTVASRRTSTAGCTSFFSSLAGLALLRFSSVLRVKSIGKLLLMVGAVAVATKLAVGQGDTVRFNNWTVNIFILTILPLLSLVISGGFLRNEIRSTTIEYLWTRPVRKSYLVLAGFISTTTWVLIQAILFVSVIYAVAYALNVPELSNSFPRTVVAVIFSVLATSAIATAASAISGKYMALGVVYGLLVETGISRLPTRLNRVSITHHVQSILDMSASASAADLVGGILGCLIITGCALALAVAVFSHRQYSIGSEKEA